MNVAQLSYVVYPYHGYGGMGKHVYHLTKFLSKNNINVHLFTALPFNNGDVFENNPNINIHFIDHYRFPPSISKLTRITTYPWFSYKMGKIVRDMVKSGKIDIVHAHGLSSFGYALQKNHDRKVNAPLITNPHGMEEFKDSRLTRNIVMAYFKAMAKYGHQTADKVIATDASMYDEISKYLGIQNDKIVIIPNAIDIEECLKMVSKDKMQQISEQYNLNDKDLIFISVGNLGSNKRFDLLIDVFDEIKDELPQNWIWILVGSGQMKKMIIRKAIKKNIIQNMVMTGWVDDATLHNLYELSDIFIHPTLYEGSSLVTLEAMIHKCPVIASAVGGIPDKVVDGKNGYLCKLGNIHDFANCILKCVGNKSIIKNMGNKSYGIVKNGFSWPEMAKKTVHMYETMLEG